MKAKNIILLFACFAAVDAMSSDDPCAEGGFFNRLSRVNGQRYIGDCTVEVHVCEKKNSAAALPYYMTKPLEANTQYWVGDIYVKQYGGQSLYLPFYAPTSRFPNTNIKLTESKDAFTYYYKDYNYDPVSGLKEMYEFTISKRRPEIKMKMKNSVESRKRPIRSLFLPNVKIHCFEN